MQDAVERNLITIGEAINLLLSIHPDLKISDARKIFNLRNQLTHVYDAVDNVMVWNVLVKYIPILKTEVKNLLNETGE